MKHFNGRQTVCPHRLTAHRFLRVSRLPIWALSIQFIMMDSLELARRAVR